jgi:hypothetical protein
MNRRLQLGLVALGVLVVVGHLVALAVAGMALSSWLTGTAIGLLLAVVGSAHLLLGRDPSASAGRQTLYGVIALAIGVVFGLVATVVPMPAWWLLLPWAVTALAIGMLLDGPPREKAARLAAYGFASAVIPAAAAHELTGALDGIVVLALGLAGAAGTVAVGAMAHAVVQRAHPA